MFNKHQVKREEHKSMLEDIAVVAKSILREIVMYSFETPSQEKVICITPKSAILQYNSGEDLAKSWRIVS